MATEERSVDLHDPPTIGFFGTIRKSKGIHLIFPALTQLPGVQLLIGGATKRPRDEEYYEQLLIQVRSLGIANRVKFLGYVSDASMADFFQSIDIAVFPYTFSTASGATHLAFAHRSVVLTSDLPVFAELKTKYDCIETFSLSSAGGLAAKLKLPLSSLGVVFSKARFGLFMMMEPKRYSRKEMCFSLRQVIPQL